MLISKTLFTYKKDGISETTRNLSDLLLRFVARWSLYTGTGYVDVRMIPKTGGEMYNPYKWSRISLFTGGYFVNVKNAEK